MPWASLIATLYEPPATDGADLTALPDAVEWLEVRADVVGDIDPDWLRDHFKGKLLYSLRTSDQPNRLERLKTAAPFYDRVELDVTTDGSLLELIPPEQRLLSWYGTAGDVAELSARFEQLASVPAGVYKLVTHASKIAEEFL